MNAPITFILLLINWPILFFTLCAASGHGDDGFVDPLGGRAPGKKSTTSVLATLDSKKIREMIASGQLKGGDGGGTGGSGHAGPASSLSKLRSSDLSKRSSLAKLSSAELSKKKAGGAFSAAASLTRFPPTSSSSSQVEPGKTQFIPSKSSQGSAMNSKKFSETQKQFLASELNTVERKDFHEMSTKKQKEFYNEIKQIDGQSAHEPKYSAALDKVTQRLRSSGLKNVGTGGQIDTNEQWKPTGAYTTTLKQKGVMKMRMRAFTSDDVIPLLNAIRVFFAQIGMSKGPGDVFTEEDMERMFTGNNRGLIVQILQSNPVPPYNLPTRVCKEMYDGVYTLVLQVEKRVPDNSLSAIRSISCAWILSQYLMNVLQSMGESGRSILESSSGFSVQILLQRSLEVFQKYEANATPHEKEVIQKTQAALTKTLETIMYLKSR